METIDSKLNTACELRKFNSLDGLIERKNISRGSDVRKTVSHKTKRSILMIGMHLTKTRGGITTLITDILRSSLKDNFDFLYVESQAEDFGRSRKAVLAIQSVSRFVWICLSKSPDLVYVHLGSNASLYRESIFILLAKIFGKKVLTHFHAGDIDNYYPLQSEMGQIFIKRAIGLSDSIIAVSIESAKQLSKIVDTSSVRVIPNAIDTTLFSLIPIERKQNAVVRLLFVGATGKLKGERDLIKALAILNKREKPNIKVSFLGYRAEDLIAECEQLGLTDLIEFLGAVSLSDRIKFYQEADIFVLPTYAEAMPISVIEAMAAGLPVISTTVGGIPELIDDGLNGLLFTPGDVNALADKISFLLDNRSLRIKIGTEARRKAQNEMSFGQYVEKLGAQLSGLF